MSVLLLALAVLGYLVMSAVVGALSIRYLETRNDDTAIAGLVWPITLSILIVMGICAVLLRIARRIERWMP